jgi:hypothetical protein
MFFAGDDTGIMFRYQTDRDAMLQAVRTIAHDANVVITYGLGLILKQAKVDFQRIGMLSKILYLHKDEPVCVRLIPNILLTNSTRSKEVTSD